MALQINTNLAALTAQRNVTNNSAMLEKTFQRLASGSRIVKSADDAAGLAISEDMKGRIRGYAKASQNAQDGISLVQIAEGALGSIGDSTSRLRELAIQAASDNVGDRERGFLNNEFTQLLHEMERTALVTEFGARKLLDGSAADEMEFQVGINNNPESDRISFTAGVDARLDALGLDGMSIEDKDGARDSLENIDEAVKRIAGMRAEFGAVQNRLQATTDQISVANENMQAANSRIRDADVALETSNLASATIKNQASVAVLSQANTALASALRLIG